MNRFSEHLTDDSESTSTCSVRGAIRRSPSRDSPFRNNLSKNKGKELLNTDQIAGFFVKNVPNTIQKYNSRHKLKWEDRSGSKIRFLATETDGHFDGECRKPLPKFRNQSNKFETEKEVS